MVVTKGLFTTRSSFVLTLAVKSSFDSFFDWIHYIMSLSPDVIVQLEIERQRTRKMERKINRNSQM